MSSPFSLNRKRRNPHDLYQPRRPQRLHPVQAAYLPARWSKTGPEGHRLCHILLGDYAAVIEAINRMEVLRYCDRIAWINPVPTGRNGEYISVMTRRIMPTE
ncbi:hypothetical protein C7271_13180 [filamentous cyanobacterium CCP5]|nr:hypothetical protein C7271_13180 [filamentous cyanobacterium CCP5]